MKERRRANPSRLTRLALGLAVAPLPAAYRQRYTMEFLAELHDVGRSSQCRHALGLALHAWDLRLALQQSGSPIPRGPIMRKSLRCTLFMHHDVTRYNGEVHPPDRYVQCTRCGRVKDIPTLDFVRGF